MPIRIPVTIHGTAEKFLVVCPTGTETVRWLCEAAYQRYQERYLDRAIPAQFIARRTSDRCLLAQMDRIGDVLNDNEAIQIGERVSSKRQIESPFNLDTAKRLDDDDAFSTAT